MGDDGMAGGAAFGDYDADGLPDLYVSNYVERAAFENGGKGLELCNWKGLRVGCGPAGLPASPDRLYHNDDGRLRDASQATGIAAVEPSYGLGVLFSDLDGTVAPISSSPMTEDLTICSGTKATERSPTKASCAALPTAGTGGSKPGWESMPRTSTPIPTST